jgi:ferredoxin
MTRPPSDVEVEIDEGLCQAVSMCITVAPGAFRLTAGGRSEFLGVDTALEVVLEAAESCPQQAITVRDAHGAQLFP